MPKIDEVYVYVCNDGPSLDDEGIPAYRMSINGLQTMVPLISGDKDRVDSVRPFAVETANRLGIKIELRKFTGYEVVEIIEPEQKGESNESTN